MRVLIVDDHQLFRLGTRHVVQSAWPDAAVTETASLADAVQAFAAAQPEIVLLDLQLPDVNGIEGVVKLVRIARDVPILVLSHHPESCHAPRLLQLGARGYLQKDRSSDELVAAMRRLLGGGRYLSPDLVDQLFDQMGPGGQPPALPHEGLTLQEFRVMELIAAGQTPARIAAAMNLSTKTVASYRARIFAKTGWRSNAELTRYCLQNGLTT